MADASMSRFTEKKKQFAKKKEDKNYSAKASTRSYSRPPKNNAKKRSPSAQRHTVRHQEDEKTLRMRRGSPLSKKPKRNKRLTATRRRLRALLLWAQTSRRRVSLASFRKNTKKQRAFSLRQQKHAPRGSISSGKTPVGCKKPGRRRRSARKLLVPLRTKRTFHPALFSEKSTPTSQSAMLVLPGRHYALRRGRRPVGRSVHLATGRAAFLPKTFAKRMSRWTKYLVRSKTRRLPKRRRGRTRRIKVRLSAQRACSTSRSWNFMDVRNFTAFLTTFRVSTLRRVERQWKRKKMKHLRRFAAALARNARRRSLFLGRYLLSRRLSVSRALSLSQSRAISAQRRLARLAAVRPSGMGNTAATLLPVAHRVLLILTKAYRLAIANGKTKKKRRAILRAVSAQLRSLVPARLPRARTRALKPAARANYLAARTLMRVMWQFVSPEFTYKRFSVLKPLAARRRRRRATYAKKRVSRRQRSRTLEAKKYTSRRRWLQLTSKHTTAKHVAYIKKYIKAAALAKLHPIPVVARKTKLRARWRYKPRNRRRRTQFQRWGKGIRIYTAKPAVVKLNVRPEPIRFSVRMFSSYSKTTKPTNNKQLPKVTAKSTVPSAKSPGVNTQISKVITPLAKVVPAKAEPAIKPTSPVQKQAPVASKSKQAPKPVATITKKPSVTIQATKVAKRVAAIIRAKAHPAAKPSYLKLKQALLVSNSKQTAAVTPNLVTAITKKPGVKTPTSKVAKPALKTAQPRARQSTKPSVIKLKKSPAVATASKPSTKPTKRPVTATKKTSGAKAATPNWLVLALRRVKQHRAQTLFRRKFSAVLRKSRAKAAVNRKFLLSSKPAGVKLYNKRGTASAPAKSTQYKKHATSHKNSKPYTPQKKGAAPVKSMQYSRQANSHKNAKPNTAQKGRPAPKNAATPKAGSKAASSTRTKARSLASKTTSVFFNRHRELRSLRYRLRRFRRYRDSRRYKYRKPKVKKVTPIVPMYLRDLSVPVVSLRQVITLRALRRVALPKKRADVARIKRSLKRRKPAKPVRNNNKHKKYGKRQLYKKPAPIKKPKRARRRAGRLFRRSQLRKRQTFLMARGERLKNNPFSIKYLLRWTALMSNRAGKLRSLQAARGRLTRKTFKALLAARAAKKKLPLRTRRPRRSRIKRPYLRIMRRRIRTGATALGSRLTRPRLSFRSARNAWLFTSRRPAFAKLLPQLVKAVWGPFGTRPALPKKKTKQNAAVKRIRRLRASRNQLQARRRQLTGPLPEYYRRLLRFVASRRLRSRRKLRVKPFFSGKNRALRRLASLYLYRLTTPSILPVWVPAPSTLVKRQRRALRAEKKKRTAPYKRMLRPITRKRTARSLTKKTARIFRARVSRRRYAKTFTRSILDPKVGPQIFLPTRYDFDLRGGIFPKKARRRLLKQRNLLQLETASIRARAAVGRRQRVLRLGLSAQGRLSVRRTSSCLRKNQKGLSYPTILPTGVFPFRKARRVRLRRTWANSFYRPRGQLSERHGMLSASIRNYSRVSPHTKQKAALLRQLRRYKPRRLTRRQKLRRLLRIKRGRRFLRRVAPRRAGRRLARVLKLRKLRAAAFADRRTKWSLQRQDRTKLWRRREQKWRRHRKPRFVYTHPLKRPVARRRNPRRTRYYSRRYAFLRAVSPVRKKLRQLRPSKRRRVNILAVTRSQCGAVASVRANRGALKRQRARAALAHLPYITRIYSLRSSSKQTQEQPSLERSEERKAANKRRLYRSQVIRKKRHDAAYAWNKQNTPLHRPSSLTFNEQFKRDIYRRRQRIFGKPAFISAYRFPSVSGYKRRRRILISPGTRELAATYKSSMPRFSPRETKVWAAKTAQANRATRRKKVVRFSRRMLSLPGSRATSPTVSGRALSTSDNVINWRNGPLANGPLVEATQTILGSLSEYERVLGAERHLKLGSGLRRLSDEQPFNPIARAPRFPALARKRRTFDAFNRRQSANAFASRTSAAFQRNARPKLKGRTLSVAPREETLRLARQARPQLHKAAVFAYPSKRQRQLIRRNGSALRPTAHKRKGLSGPSLRHHRAFKRTKAANTRPCVSSAALLQAALQLHYSDRRMRDLRKFSRRRRLSSGEQTPFWERFSVARREELTSKHVPYGQAISEYTELPTRFYWAFSEFAAFAPRRTAKTPRVATVMGEALATSRTLRSIAAKLPETPNLRSRLRKWKKAKRIRKKLAIRMRKRRRARPLKKRAERLAKRLRRRKKSIKRKLTYYRSSRPLSVKSVRSALRKAEAAARSRATRFVSYTQQSMVLSPLHFRKHTLDVSVSEEEKRRRYLHIRATRQRQYRRLIELTDALTAFYPQLISKLVSKKMARTALDESSAAAAVQSTYWNLRMYLRTFAKGPRAAARRRSVAQFSALRGEVTANAEERPFSLQDLRVARFRLQPHVAHAAPSLKRGATEWLRRFLPKFYELNVEDAEKYKHLTVTPIKIFRSHLNRAATTAWKARSLPGTMESQLSRLTSPRASANSARFENMLMTTRRTPSFSGFGAAATLRVINPVGASSARTSFFYRPFSTDAPQSDRVDYNTAAVLLTRAELVERGASSETREFSGASSTLAGNAVNSRVLAKAWTQLAPDPEEDTTHSPDMRLVRLKSPRNAEYLRRLPDSLKPAVQSFVYSTQKQRQARRAPSPVAHCTQRAFTYKTDSRMQGLPRLFAARAEATQRRLVLPRHSRTVPAKSPKTPAARRLFTLLFRTQRRAMVSFLRSCKKAMRSKDQSAKNPRSKKLANDRSVLHHRQANTRSLHLNYRTLPTIPENSVRLKASARFVLKKASFGARLASRIRYRKARRAARHRLASRSKKIAKRFRGGKKIRTKRNKLSFYKHAFVRWIRASKSPITRNRPETVRVAKKSKTTKLRVRFRTRAKKWRKADARRSVLMQKVEKRQLRTLFANRRRQLWAQLTLRYMKKERLLKHWLKIVKYSFKEKSWVRAVKFALRGRAKHRKTDIMFSDTLFKASRLRLRKLEWRESDEKFDREGLKYAFSFHPSERKHNKWLEPMLLKRALYTTRRGEYRRHQFPREQKARKWLQRVRRQLFQRKLSLAYVKSRRWPQLRTYNQRLHRSLFHLRNSKAALKRFRKLSRRKPRSTASERSMLGFGDRLDVNLILLNIAPTVFWARRMANYGLLRVNGQEVRDPNFRFQPDDYVEFATAKIQKYRSYFKKMGTRRPDYRFDYTPLSCQLPGNFAYYPQLHAARYLRLPQPEDLPENSRLSSLLFRWYRLDSGLGR